MPEPTGFSANTKAMAALYDAQPASSTLFFNALAGRDARGPAKTLTILLRELRAKVAKGETVTAADIVPAAHRMSDEEREVWHIIAAALAAAAHESPTPV